MKSDSYIIRSLLLWLLQDPDPTDSTPSGNRENANTAFEPTSSEFGSEGSSLDIWDALDADTWDSLSQEGVDGEVLSSVPLLSEFGEVPVVQDRFHSVLKRRFQTEFERRPPLFPWETEVSEYPLDYATPSVVGVAGEIWLRQLRSLSLPTQLPDQVLATLLERCQTIAHTSLKRGVKLVRAVESLFPDQPQALGAVAQIVLTPAYRGAPAVSEVQLPQGYESATPQQQIALTMLAAQEIMAALTLTLSVNQPQMVREWQTTAGLVTLEAIYQTAGAAHIQLQAQIPGAGSLMIQGEGVEATAERETAGTLTVTLPQPQVGQLYTLQIGLAADPQPLQFVIGVMEGTNALG